MAITTNSSIKVKLAERKSSSSALEEREFDTRDRIMPLSPVST
jgi:hypothetical protein